ncbi:MAG: GTP cyclohydrolase FolE2 [Planctomycetota bacterium]
MSTLDHTHDARTAKRGLMPDIAHEATDQLTGTLDKVGMRDIEVPVRLRDNSGQVMLVPAKADAFVSLDDPQAKGIHMSRLFLSLQAILSEEELNLQVVKQILHAFVGSHALISRSAAVKLSFDLLVRRKALVSANQSWRTYPVSVAGDIKDGRTRFRLSVRVAYSSTCPCSAALARQLIQEQFKSDHAGRTAVPTDEVSEWLLKESSICATPHSQRSYANLDVEVSDPAQAPTLVELIDLVETTLQTPVQAAVKREDEQEFARLNGMNLMFCEDAGRRLKQALDRDPRLNDWRVEARHVESLHPHDAVSMVVKGVPGGLRA